jgi:hypothetical protein
MSELISNIVFSLIVQFKLGGMLYIYTLIQI